MHIIYITQWNDTQNFPNINQIIPTFNDTQCPNFNEWSAKNTHVSRSRSQHFPNNDAELIPKVYIIRKLKIFPNIRTGESAHVASLHTFQVRMNRPMRVQACRTSTIAETVLGRNIRLLSLASGERPSTQTT